MQYFCGEQNHEIFGQCVGSRGIKPISPIPEPITVSTGVGGAKTPPYGHLCSLGFLICMYSSGVTSSNCEVNLYGCYLEKNSPIVLFLLQHSEFSLTDLCGIPLTEKKHVRRENPRYRKRKVQ